MGSVIRNEKLFCTCCGGEFTIVYPLAIPELSKNIEDFESLHKNCKQTWVEPEADYSKSMNDRAMDWMAHGERGMSSKAMWFCLMGKPGERDHPYDPDDFRRCWKLLEAVPEWKKQLNKLRMLSPQWNNLVDNWDKLTEYYENMRVVKKANGMYEFMQTLINISNEKNNH